MTEPAEASASRGRDNLTNLEEEEEGRPREIPTHRRGSPIVGGLLTQLRVTRKDDGHSSPSRLHALGEDPTPMHLHELLGDAQAKAESPLVESEVPGGVATRIELGEEWLEQCSSARGSRPTPRSSTTISASSGRSAAPSGCDLPASGVNLIALVSRLMNDRGDLVRVDLEVPEVLGHLDRRSSRRTWTNGGPGRPPVGSGRPGRPGLVRRVLRKSSARIKVNVLVTRRASCRPLAVIRSTIACSWRPTVRIREPESSPNPRTSVIGVLNSWLATSMNAALELAGLGQLLVGLDQPGVGRLKFGDQPFAFGQQLVLLGRLADDAFELRGVPRLEDVAENVPFIDGIDHRLDVGVAGEEHPDRRRA